jgi:hypothetical protein
MSDASAIGMRISFPTERTAMTKEMRRIAQMPTNASAAVFLGVRILPSIRGKGRVRPQ